MDEMDDCRTRCSFYTWQLDPRFQEYSQFPFQWLGCCTTKRSCIKRPVVLDFHVSNDPASHPSTSIFRGMFSLKWCPLKPFLSLLRQRVFDNHPRHSPCAHILVPTRRGKHCR